MSIKIRETKIDQLNAVRYSYERQKIKMFNHYLKILPHIFSHVNVEISFNTKLINNNYERANHHIYVRLMGSKEFCKQIHCNVGYPRGKTCTVEDKPFIFKSGNSDIGACHSACYNLFENRTDENGLHYRAPFVNYSTRMCKCLIQNENVFRMATDDFMRTDVHPTPRIDTIGTGFDLDPNPYVDGHKNETFHFKLNEYYCDDFQYEFKNGKCQSSIVEDVFSLFGSSNLYKFGQYGKRYVQSGEWINDVQRPNLPPITSRPPPSYRDWLSNINKTAIFIDPNLCLSDLGIVPGAMHLIFTTEFGWPGLLVEPLLFYKTPNLYARYNEPI